MGDTFVVPIFHHGGKLVRNPLGELKYVNGMVERFEEMNLDHVNLGDMEKLLESLRYTKYKAVYWLDKNAPELEAVLNEIEGDAGIREMIDYLRMNLEFEFHLYWEHVINELVMVEEANVGAANAGANSWAEGGSSGQPINLDDATVSSEDGYESVEDMAYKPPPPGNDDSELGAKKRKVAEAKKGVSPKKIVHPKKGKCGKKGNVTGNGKKEIGKRMGSGVGPNRLDGPGGANGPGDEHVGDGPGYQVNSSSSLDYVKKRKGRQRWRPKVQNKRRDPVENLIDGDKLKKSFRVTCAKCGEKGHNYKTCKGPPANPNWKPQTNKSRKTSGTSSTPQVEVPVSQSAPQPDANDMIPQHVKPSTGPSITTHVATTKRLRKKQPIRRKALRKSPPLSEPPISSQNAGPSMETIAAASAGIQSRFKFM
ncbi:hypothetical protein PIB30_035368 [Stylosanthes scabra]|uniref:CCHC-type domain-containing protein n=1 Tax=Stylosanthes scabra TaxID=79078 RepID=A0ABU6XEN4_9FABA|nr:hypothetical protein [Stylosanthes scabra]